MQINSLICWNTFNWFSVTVYYRNLHPLYKCYSLFPFVMSVLMYQVYANNILRNLFIAALVCSL